MTTITVHHTPRDLLQLGFFATLRSPTLRWALLAIAVVVLGINLRQQQSHLDPITLFAIVITTVIFTGAAFILILAINPLLAVLRNGKRSPAAEVHAYSLAEAGLVRKSASSESLLKWGGARSLHKGRSAIYVGVSTSSYFILPRRSFANDQEFQSFWIALQMLAPNTSPERPRAR